MKNIRPVLACALALALILLSPGFPFYQALAADHAGRPIHAGADAAGIGARVHRVDAIDAAVDTNAGDLPLDGKIVPVADPDATASDQRIDFSQAPEAVAPAQRGGARVASPNTGADRREQDLAMLTQAVVSGNPTAAFGEAAPAPAAFDYYGARERVLAGPSPETLREMGAVLQTCSGGGCPFSGAPQAAQEPPPYEGGPVAGTQPYGYGRIVSTGNKLVQWLMTKLDVKAETGWPTFPKWAGVWMAFSEVLMMRLKNMHNTRYLTNEASPIPWKPEYSHFRSPTGHWIDKRDGNIGAPGMAKSYNVNPKFIQPRPPHPNLIEIGVNHLSQDTFKPAPVNQQFGSHLQAQVEGWFGTNLSDDSRKIEIKLPSGYNWHEQTMTIRRTPEAPNRKPGIAGPPVYLNEEAPDWALRQVYGKSKEDQDKIRSFKDGKLKIEPGPDGLLPADPKDPRIMAVGQPRNTWIARAVDDIDKVLYHNYLADGLRRYYTQGLDFNEMGWGLFARIMYYLFDHRRWKVEKAMFAGMNEKERDEWLFQLAWLGNAATVASYHTDDWTVILFYGSNVLQTAMKIDLSGFLTKGVKKLWYDKPWAHRSLGRIINNDLLSGMAGSKMQRWSSPYDLGNSFVDAYRIPELVRPNLTFYDYKTGKATDFKDMGDLQGFKTLEAMKGRRMIDMDYSLGLNLAGDEVANNVAPFFYNLHAMHGETIDRRVRDIFRQDERGTPLYNANRRAHRLPPAKDFLDLTKGDVEKAEQLSKDYNGDIEAVHLHIGKRVAPRPLGIVIPHEDFIDFSLNAPARYAGNRFLSELFVPGVYTPWLINQVLKGSFKHVKLTVRPELAPALDGLSSAFLPYNRLHPQLDPKIDAEEKALGIETHSADRLAAYGPLALDTLYRNSTAGEIPDGISAGTAVFLPATRGGAIVNKLVSHIWKGKVFDKKSGTLKNRIGDGQSIKAKVFKGQSWFDGKPSIIVDYLKTSWLAWFIRDEIRQVGPTTYLGRAYVRLPFGRRAFLSNFALEFPGAEPETARLAAAVEQTAAKAGMADIRNSGIGLGLAALAWWFGADASMTVIPAFVLAHLPVALATLLAPVAVMPSIAVLGMLAFLPAAFGIWSWSKRRPSLIALRNVVRLSAAGPRSRIRQFKPLFDAESNSHGASKLSKFAAFTILDTAALIAWRLFAVHPAIALIIGAVGIGAGLVALRRSSGFAKAVDMIRPRLYGLLAKGQAKRDPASIIGTNDIERRYMFGSEDGTPNVATLRSDFLSLRRLGRSILQSAWTTASSHVAFGRKTQTGMTPHQKLMEEIRWWHIYVPNIIDAHDPNGTGVYARAAKTLKDGTKVKQGDVDLDVFNSWFPAGQDRVTRAGMDAFFEAGMARSGSSWLVRIVSRLAFKQRMSQLFDVFSDLIVYENGNPVRAISREQLLSFLKGTAAYDVAGQRAGVGAEEQN